MPPQGLPTRLTGLHPPSVRLFLSGSLAFHPSTPSAWAPGQFPQQIGRVSCLKFFKWPFEVLGAVFKVLPGLGPDGRGALLCYFIPGDPPAPLAWLRAWSLYDTLGWVASSGQQGNPLKMNEVSSAHLAGSPGLHSVTQTCLFGTARCWHCSRCRHGPEP